MYTKLSKYISYLLRHNPGDLDLNMDHNGWVSCKELVNKIHKTGKYIINIDILKQIVKENDKQRYAFSKNGDYIRANQGHSINVDMEYTPVKPPDYLYHDTDLYNNDDTLGHEFNAVVGNVFNSFNNLNYWINRVKPYNPKGRHQTEEEADALIPLLNFVLRDNHVHCTEYRGIEEDYDKIVKDVLRHVKEFNMESMKEANK